MAYTSNVEETYDHTASIREDLNNEVTIASPVTTPMMFAIGFRQKANNTYVEWTADNVTGPDVTGQVGASTGATGETAFSLEGGDAVFPAQDQRQRIANYTSIVTRAVDVSDTQRTMLQAGITDEFAFKIWKAMLKAGEQFDYNLHWQTADAGAVGSTEGSGTGRRLHGVAPFIFYTGIGVTSGSSTQSVSIAGQSIFKSTADLRTGYSGTYYQGDGDAMTRDEFHTNMLKPAWQRGMTIDGSIALCGANVKNVVSEFALAYDSGTVGTVARSERNIPAAEHHIHDKVDYYTTNYGTIAFNLDRHMENTQTYAYDSGESPGQATIDVDTTMIILEPDFWGVRMLRGLSYTPLAKIGDASKGQVVMEGTLQCSNPICGILGNEIAA